MKKIILKIEGMTCSACSNGLEKYLSKQDGIISATVNLVMANALIEFDEDKLDIKKIENFIKKAGFKSLGVYDDQEKNTPKEEKTKFIIFAVLAVILMYISMGHMAKLPIPEVFNMHSNPIIYTVSLFILTIVFLLHGHDILKKRI